MSTELIKYFNSNQYWCLIIYLCGKLPWNKRGNKHSASCNRKINPFRVIQDPDHSFRVYSAITTTWLYIIPYILFSHTHKQSLWHATLGEDKVTQQHSNLNSHCIISLMRDRNLFHTLFCCQWHFYSNKCFINSKTCTSVHSNRCRN